MEITVLTCVLIWSVDSAGCCIYAVSPERLTCGGCRCISAGRRGKSCRSFGAVPPAYIGTDLLKILHMHASNLAFRPPLTGLVAFDVGKRPG